MCDITRVLSQIELGDPSAAEQLLPLVYDELRKLAAARLAQEKPGQTLQATALVHEAYLRLARPGAGSQESGVDTERSEVGGQKLDKERPAADSRSPTPGFASRGHFFAAAAESMRRILVDRARQKAATKRGGELTRIELKADLAAAPEIHEDLLALDEALDRLAAEYPHQAELVKLRYFGGLSLPDAAATLGISERTAGRQWAFARAWLRREVEGAGERN